MLTLPCSNGYMYYAMEYKQGDTLDSRLGCLFYKVLLLRFKHFGRLLNVENIISVGVGFGTSRSEIHVEQINSEQVLLNYG